jgi:2-polyprenyl-3-methyl-5-hydroxy-6-metoxy-1,4-benzoquinol methylase
MVESYITRVALKRGQSSIASASGGIMVIGKPCTGFLPQATIVLPLLEGNAMSTSTLAANDRPEPGPADKRFAFGKNWQRFLQHLTEERIAVACNSLSVMLQAKDLKGKSFLDVGSGSGLFSLAAMRLGAAKVHSFDYDSQSAACARELKQRFFPDAENWSVEQGSVLDADYLRRLGTFDVVYAWGVLHHTGNMWQALENVAAMVPPGGKLFVALYNDEGRRSRFWRSIKHLYGRNVAWRACLIAIFGFWFTGKGFIKDLLLLKNPLARFREYKQQRGMSYFTDMLDWLGGYPFEVARVETVFNFFHTRGFELIKLQTPGQPKGNNEFVFLNRRLPAPTR